LAQHQAHHRIDPAARQPEREIVLRQLYKMGDADVNVRQGDPIFVMVAVSTDYLLGFANDLAESAAFKLQLDHTGRRGLDAN